MSCHLKIEWSAFHGLINYLGRNPSGTVSLPAGTGRIRDRLELIVHEANSRRYGEATLVSVATEDVNHVRSRLQTALDYSCGELRAFICLGLGTARGRISGACFTAGQLTPLQDITIVGPGMLRISLTPQRSGSESMDPPVDIYSTQHHSIGLPALERWSRSIAAVGEVSWRRLAALNICVVGCGRTGSLVATSLIAFGVQRITLIDPDRIEQHNLGEMQGVDQEDVGGRKVLAVAASLSRKSTTAQPRRETVGAPAHVDQEIIPLPESIRKRLPEAVL